MSNPLAASRDGIEISRAPVQREARFSFGTKTDPRGRTIEADNVSLLRDGRPWLPTMGEIHYARVPRDAWRDELLKMRAGGIDVVATYVFWIHHEEIEGTLDWTGDRDLRAFLAVCRELDVPLVLRVGPWCHGEVRNGGLPDWLLPMGDRLRTDDVAYLATVARWFEAIRAQTTGELWKDGGPIVGLQIENEYSGPGSHLLTLKRMAVAAGFDVPLYTRTGWPELASPIAFGELLPLHGAYAEGFWDRTLEPMPGRYWEAFRFETTATAAGIATDHFGDRADERAEHGYPFLTCECGGGMMSSYHRRIRVHPRDAAAVALVKLGSGSNLPGYYMYHGGRNPIGQCSTLQETQASAHTNWNDLPERNYDFQAPLGAFGEQRESFRRLRRLHTFCRDFGPALTDLPVALPAALPNGRDDLETLRWSTRVGRGGGYLFINNYQRLASMPTRRDVRLQLRTPSGARSIPEWPIDLPADASVIWPIDLSLSPGVTLRYATAQPVCRLGDTVVFAAVDGIRADFSFDVDGQRRDFLDMTAGRQVAIRFDGVSILLLDDADSLRATKASSDGRDVLILSDADLFLDGDTVRLTSRDGRQPSATLIDENDTVRTLHLPLVAVRERVCAVSRERAAGPPRHIPLSRTGMAMMPTLADFEGAATFRIALPDDVPADSTLRLRYIGDVARVTAGEHLLIDDFYNGDVVEIDLAACAAELAKGPLRVSILAMPSDAPIAVLSPLPFDPPHGVEPALLSATIHPRATARFSLREELRR